MRFPARMTMHLLVASTCVLAPAIGAAVDISRIEMEVRRGNQLIGQGYVTFDKAPFAAYDEWRQHIDGCRQMGDPCDDFPQSFELEMPILGARLDMFGRQVFATRGAFAADFSWGFSTPFCAPYYCTDSDNLLRIFGSDGDKFIFACEGWVREASWFLTDMCDSGGAYYLAFSANGREQDPRDRFYYREVTVPEPGSLALLTVGLMGLGWARRRH